MTATDSVPAGTTIGPFTVEALIGRAAWARYTERSTANSNAVGAENVIHAL